MKIAAGSAWNVWPDKEPSARAVLDKSTSEDDLLATITDALTLFGYVWTHHRRSDKALTMGTPGVPDVIAARNGVLWMIELKSARGHETPDQLRWALAFPGESHTFRYRLWRPADLDAALAELAKP